MNDIDTLLNKLADAQFASCSCMTKTPEVKWHHSNCKYRIFFEAYKMIFNMREILESVNKHGATIGSEQWLACRKLLKLDNIPL